MACDEDTRCKVTVGILAFEGISRNENAFFLERPRRGSWRARTREGASVAAMASAASREMAPTASSGSVDVNGTMRGEYRGRRCPRWRMRDATSGRPRPERGAGGSRSTRRAKTLLVDADGGEPFEKTHETDDGIVVWMRASNDASCAAKEVMAVATFRDCTAARFRRAVLDAERYAEFVPFVQTSFAVAVERTPNVKIETNASASGAHDAHDAHDANADANAGVHPDVVWVYNRVKLPFVSARDYSIKIVSSTRAHTHAGSDETCVFVSTWTEDTSVGPAPKKGVVRLRRNRGSWRVADAADGGVAVTYRALADPGPGVPGWLVDVANKRSVPDVLRAFERRARSGVYEAEDEENFRNSRDARKAGNARSRSFFFPGRNDIFGAFGAFRFPWLSA